MLQSKKEPGEPFVDDAQAAAPSFEGKRQGKWITAMLLFALSLPAAAQHREPEKPTLQRPRLVVGIVIDQMRWDYLYRYYDRYGAGGFRRLLREGFSCENTLINYLPSATAVGHTTIYTGSVPSIDGIAGNNWIDQSTGREWYCTEDTTVEGVGSSSKEGKMSPRNLLVSTITDELRLAGNFQSQVVGVSLKDRAAILPAGHTATGAFWLDDKSGHFITSTYYMQQLPRWVQQFNDADPIGRLIAGGWHTLYPIDTYQESSPDDVPWEGLMHGKTAPVFPYDIAGYYTQKHGVFRQTPFGNTLTLQFAAAAVRGYRMGQGHATDFLTINCASTDYVGHFFGPNAIETEDTYLRLDRDLSVFFQFLDATIGKNKYLVFLTADHGAGHSLGYMKTHHLPAEQWEDEKMIQRLNAVLNDEFHVGGLIRAGSGYQVNAGTNYQLNFDMQKIGAGKLDPEKIKTASVQWLREQPGVLYAMDMERIGEEPVPQRIKEMAINGYNYRRSGAVQIIPQTGWLPSYSKKGTTHGAWNPYDTHIPLIFMGWKIAHGATNRSIRMTDIAPTLAALLHIQMPNGCIGSPITEIVNK